MTIGEPDDERHASYIDADAVPAVRVRPESGLPGWKGRSTGCTISFPGMSSISLAEGPGPLPVGVPLLCRYCRDRRRPVSWWAGEPEQEPEVAHRRCEGLYMLYHVVPGWPRTPDRAEEIRRLERAFPGEEFPWREQWGRKVPTPISSVVEMAKPAAEPEPGAQPKARAPRRFSGYTVRCRKPGCMKKGEYATLHEASWWITFHKRDHPDHGPYRMTLPEGATP